MEPILDSELRDDFLIEADELLQRLGEQLIALERAPHDVGLLGAVSRAFHTIKGGAGFLGLHAMVQLCRRAGDLLDQARDATVVLGMAQMDVLLEALDLLNGMLRTLARGESLASAPAALSRRSVPARTDGVARAEGGPAADPVERIFEGMLATARQRQRPSLAVASSGGINDCEFEALLDSLYGKGRGPGSTPPPPVEARATLTADAPAERGVRDDGARLDALLHCADELLRARNRLLSVAERRADDSVTVAATDLQRLAEELRGAALALRMQPIGRLFQHFPRSAPEPIEQGQAGADTERGRGLAEPAAIIQPVLMVRVGDCLFALPSRNVEEVFELADTPDRLRDGRRVATHRGRALALADLASWAGLDLPPGRQVLLLRIGQLRLGLLVHEVLGREEAMVKPAGPLFGGTAGIAGTIVAGDGQLALLLDLAELAEAGGPWLASLKGSVSRWT